jgi:hypothetical protein
MLSSLRFGGRSRGAVSDSEELFRKGSTSVGFISHVIGVSNEDTRANLADSAGVAFSLWNRDERRGITISSLRCICSLRPLSIQTCLFHGARRLHSDNRPLADRLILRPACISLCSLVSDFCAIYNTTMFNSARPLR